MGVVIGGDCPPARRAYVPPDRAKTGASTTASTRSIEPFDPTVYESKKITSTQGNDVAGPDYVEEIVVKEREGTDTTKYRWQGGNCLSFGAGEISLTVFLDFAVTRGIWRVDTKFYHDDSRPGTTADFGVADSAVISKLFSKYLYNNPDSCSYYLDKSSAKLSIGKTPKTLLSYFNVRNGTQVSLEIDMNEKIVRFYNNNKLVPAVVKIKPISLHIGFTGRWSQHFDGVTLRRLERPTLKPTDKPELIEWK